MTEMFLVKCEGDYGSTKHAPISFELDISLVGGTGMPTLIAHECPVCVCVLLRLFNDLQVSINPMLEWWKKSQAVEEGLMEDE